MNKFAAPEFAMSFTQEAVLLERRDGQDWRSLGNAPYMSGNVATKLNSLRGDNDNEGSGPDTVLVIPDEQILYTTLTVPPGSDMPATIGRALEGMTPYKAEELAFDWCPDENGQIDSLRVAAVARITLKEAEEFARAQGFQPLGFEARPGDGRFAGQPDFGLSQLAREQQRVVPFSKPSLHKAGITSDRIEIEEAPEDIPPTITRIIPHVYAAPVSPDPVAKAPVSVEPETIQKADLNRDHAGKPVGAAVIRHGEARADTASPTMSERARAVHARAAEARTQRSDDAGSTDKAAMAGLLTRFRGAVPSTFTIMMGLLVISLLAIWLFMGSPKEAPEITAQPENATANEADPETVQTEASAPAETETEGQADEAAAEPELPDAAGAAAGLDATSTAGEAATAQIAEDPEDAAAEQADPLAPAQETPPQDALTAALNEAMSGQAADSGAVAGGNGGPDTVTDGPLRGESEAVTETVPDAAISAARDTVSPETTNEAAAQPPDAAAENTDNAAVAETAPATQLNSSARPPSDRPELPAPASAGDIRPTVPPDPQPYEDRAAPEPVQMTGQRPPTRPRSQPAPEAPPTAGNPETAAPATSPPAATDASPNNSSTSPRPAPRPGELTFLEEGSAREPDGHQALTQDEQEFLKGVLRELRTAQAGDSGLGEAERGAVIRLAQARPEARPLPVSGPSEDAVQHALESALSTSERPEPRGATAQADASPPPSSDQNNRAASLNPSLNRSARPATRPGGGANSSLAKDAIENAIASAVKASSASPGSVGLAALTSSAIPPRRSGSNAPTADELRGAAQKQEAERKRARELAEQRRRDAKLQAQAERRARERAAADARAEAQARAAAEARARAQAEAEARAAAARNQRYTPPEAEKEPEVSGPVPDGRTRTTAAATATIKDGIPLRSTQIIGTFGAGKASRALVRLSNGKIITLRLGDKINGGRITAIGDSRITYVEGGRSKQLSVLSGK